MSPLSSIPILLETFKLGDMLMYDKFYDVFLPQPLIWKAVEGFEGAYEVSNYGQIRSLDRTVEYYREGVLCTKNHKGRILKPKLDKDGYESYCLVTVDKRRNVRGHRLVAQAFIDGGSEDLVVDHKNTKVACNHVWNLQWMTPAQNTIKHFSEERGSERPLSKLSKEEWLEIGELYNQGLSYSEIVERFKLTVKRPDTIWNVLKGEKVKSITGFKKGDFQKRVHPVQKLSDEDIFNVLKARLIDKKGLKEISKEFGIAESMISRYCSGNRRPEIRDKFKEEWGI